MLLQLCHSAISCLKIYPFWWNTAHSYESVFHSHNNWRHSRVWRKQNKKFHAKCIQVSKCASLGLLAAEVCLFWEKWIVTWTVQNTRVILFMVLKWQVNAQCSHRRHIPVWTILRHASIRKILEHSRILFNTRSGMARKFVRDVSHRERLEYNEERDW